MNDLDEVGVFLQRTLCILEGGLVIAELQIAPRPRCEAVLARPVRQHPVWRHCFNRLASGRTEEEWHMKGRRVSWSWRLLETNACIPRVRWMICEVL